MDKHSPFGDTILSLSLGSSVVMDWRHRSGKYAPVLVPGRSMLVMRDEARCVECWKAFKRHQMKLLEMKTLLAAASNHF